jgi:hypothetical protein
MIAWMKCVKRAGLNSGAVVQNKPISNDNCTWLLSSNNVEGKVDNAAAEVF